MFTERRRATEAEAAALASGIRLRIIRLTFSEALTNKELAERLGRDPATTLHHVRKLVDTGFLTAQPSRRGARGAKEIPYLSTGLSWLLDTHPDQGVDQAMLEAYLAEIADTRFERVEQTRLVLQVGSGGLEEFKGRLEGLLEEFRARPVEPLAERTAVYVSLYPSR
ncbi:ArsR/SmtB family transcription factor [Amycolatopsis sp. H20-H5]|uniref:ArsR/SmtB family transcription factor n=1 Tax=Amycolatopsis sp. H20-H5 TaxID=3046309 RepID=UPI002DB76461|nr:winged helix-turn-helix domain-containing protein [Amycolatopsis sp. H20-H5]MEC3973987.1 winged helix-turn-helix domain-containing protein [Amycolatopsis sp. H20-H5]